MHLVINRSFIRRKDRIGKIGIIVGFAAFLVGIAFVLQVKPETGPEIYIGAYGSVIVGLIAFNVGSLHYQLWSRKPTPLEAITAALKGLHKKSVLFSYLPHLPADHVLLTPGGVFVLLAKHVDGKVSGGGERWKHVPERRFAALLNPFSQIRLGNPVMEAKTAESSLRKMIVGALGPDQASLVPVESVVVFTNPLARVELQDPAVAALVPDQLHSHISQSARGKLSAGQLDRLAELLKAEFKVEDEERKRSKARRAYARR